jgi:hypothetical protein
LKQVLVLADAAEDLEAAKDFYNAQELGVGVAEFGLRWQAFGREPNFTEGGAERERVRLGNPGNRDSGE